MISFQNQHMYIITTHQIVSMILVNAFLALKTYACRLGSNFGMLFWDDTVESGNSKLRFVTKNVY